MPAPLHPGAPVGILLSPAGGPDVATVASSTEDRRPDALNTQPLFIASLARQVEGPFATASGEANAVGAGGARRGRGEAR